MQQWKKICLGLSGIGFLLFGYLGLYQPQWIFRLVSKLRPGALFFVDTDKPIIALTIDDGPHEETTEAILQVLERHGVRATFFMLSDEISGYETTVQRLVANGNELGNHMTTDESSIQLSSADFQTKFTTAAQTLSAYGDVTWFRPGMGWYNYRMIDFVESQGYQLVLGSIFPYDTHLPSTKFATWFILNNLDPGDILVLHDGPENRGERTVQLLEQLIPRIQKRGYRIVTLTELKNYEQ
ncbi:MAG: polysaccharide deacetylase family protein [Leptolyngbya sp. SIO3F4]|nr:polysaccharide deacetylase family protein [Leptolyngbya sp. SIO3F4]